MANVLAQDTSTLLPPSGFEYSWTKRVDTEGHEEIETGLPAKTEERTAGSLHYQPSDEFKVPVMVFGGSDLRLRPLKPVTVRIRRGESLWFAENERLDVYATGDTAQKAIEELVSHVLFFYRHYRELEENRAAAVAKKLKAIYSTAFEVLYEG